MTIGIIYLATGPYIEFFSDFYDTAEKNFVLEAQKFYYVFTDRYHPYLEKSNVVHIPQHQEFWPFVALHKFHYILEAEHLYKNCDFLFMTNANIIFKEHINFNDFDLNSRFYITAVEGPWLYYNQTDKNSYFEENKQSSAFVPKELRKTYFASGFLGGKVSEFLTMAFEIRNMIETDLSKNIFAKWEDQAYVNKYLLYNLSKVKILSPSYLYPEEHKINFQPKIIVRYKQEIKNDPLKRKYRRYIWDNKREFKNKFQYYRHIAIYNAIKLLKKLDK